MEASGIAVRQRTVRVKKEKVYRKKFPEPQKVTSALRVCLSKLLVLPKKLLKEDLPAVSCVLFKTRKLVRVSP
jgi:hypothetical protein